MVNTLRIRTAYARTRNNTHARTHTHFFSLTQAGQQSDCTCAPLTSCTGPITDPSTSTTYNNAGAGEGDVTLSEEVHRIAKATPTPAPAPERSVVVANTPNNDNAGRDGEERTQTTTETQDSSSAVTASLSTRETEGTDGNGDGVEEKVVEVTRGLAGGLLTRASSAVPRNNKGAAAQTAAVHR